MRALMLDPTVLLLDEPLGALDPVTRFGLQEELKGLFSDLGKTVVMVTHDMSEAAYLGDDVVLLHEGVLQEQGPVARIMHHPQHPYTREFFQARRPFPLERQ